ncbi:hypothetical protein [Rufibacter roseus]|uniref:Uncharacterized protein n=1 Tax=Rufibacter roseus TaxID=1567108 RepID=A0ABW2DTN0_9BACT|nr:hypothetical protein [Rufibacter roseus]
MHDIKIAGYDRQLPSKWNEVTGEQLVRIIAAELRIMSVPKLPAKQKLNLFRIERLRILLSVPEVLLLSITPVQIMQFFWLMPFFQKGYTGLTAQLFPKLRLPSQFIGTNLYGPRERIRNMTFLEFIYVDTFFVAYTKKQSPNMLDKLIASMYRPKKWFHFLHRRLPNYDGDCRQPFNQHFLDRRAEKIAKLSLEQKLAILCWYRGCREELEKEFPLVFTQEKQRKASRSGWDGVLLGMSGHVINIEATGRANIRNILGMMQQRFEEIGKSKSNRNEN